MNSFSITIDQYDIPLAEVIWRSENGEKASSLTFSFPKNCFEPEAGQTVCLYDDNDTYFLGYIFEIQVDEMLCHILAYDQLRYLMFKDTYIFKQKKIDDIIQSIANDVGVKTGKMERGNYALDMIAENKKLLDIIQQAIKIEKENTGNDLLLCDDDGQLCLLSRNALQVEIELSEDSQMTAFNKVISIDGDTFNRIKLTQKNKKKGLQTVTTQQDDEKIQKWGTLQYYERVDEGLSSTQVMAMAQQLLVQKARPTKEWTIKAIGNPIFRAGYYVSVRANDEAIFGTIKQAVHTINNGRYEMKLYIQEEEGMA